MIRFSSKLPHNCYEKCPKYGYFSFLALSGFFFQARAPKLMQTFIFWVYSAKKKVASSFRYSNYYSYWPTSCYGFLNLPCHGFVEGFQVTRSDALPDP